MIFRLQITLSLLSISGDVSRRSSQSKMPFYRYISNCVVRQSYIFNENIFIWKDVFTLEWYPSCGESGVSRSKHYFHTVMSIWNCNFQQICRVYALLVNVTLSLMNAIHFANCAAIKCQCDIKLCFETVPGLWCVKSDIEQCHIAVIPGSLTSMD